MQQKLIMTGDGSHSVSVPDLGVTYHSVHGAIQESRHVFIKAGLEESRVFDFVGQHELLEIGFGTGLNALLTLVEADRHRNRIYYTGVDIYPLDGPIAKELNYCEQLNIPRYQPLFQKMYECQWEEMVEISEFFRLTKIKRSFLDFNSEQNFFLIYFDAFAPSAQPELWTKEVFEKLYSMLLPEGILVTYCSKGQVRRNMQAAGFSVEKLPGAKGKREMLRAKKFNQ